MPETRGNLNIGHELSVLRAMTPRELREKYRQVFGEVTRVGNKAHLIKRIAWRLQSLAEGSLSERARRRAEELARDEDIRLTIPRAPRGGASRAGTKRGTGLETGSHVITAAAPFQRDERIPPGGIIAREYDGRVHTVTVLPKGFEYDGRVFRSLSAAAKAITGSHWNGYAFFKIAKSKPEAADA